MIDLGGLSLFRAVDEEETEAAHQNRACMSLMMPFVVWFRKSVKIVPYSSDIIWFRGASQHFSAQLYEVIWLGLKPALVHMWVSRNAVAISPTRHHDHHHRFSIILKRSVFISGLPRSMQAACIYSNRNRVATIIIVRHYERYGIDHQHGGRWKRRQW